MVMCVAFMLMDLGISLKCKRFYNVFWSWPNLSENFSTTLEFIFFSLKLNLFIGWLYNLLHDLQIFYLDSLFPKLSFEPLYFQRLIHHGRNSLSFYHLVDHQIFS
jgi:hypothetical protein